MHKSRPSGTNDNSLRSHRHPHPHLGGRTRAPPDPPNYVGKLPPILPNLTFMFLTNIDFIYEIMKSQNGDDNMGAEAEQQIFLKVDKVHTPWPMSH